MNKLLIVEDDRELNRGLGLALAGDSIDIAACFNLKDARRLISDDLSLVILDIDLPDGSGLDLLMEIRKNHPDVHVILLTASDTEDDIVKGLGLGADDYVTKPFSLTVLRARVENQLRRLRDSSSLTYFSGIYEFDFLQGIVTADGRVLQLNRTELKLLETFVTNRGITLLRDRLIDAVWGDDPDSVEDNALSVTVKRLRDKLRDTKHIQTVYGIGYKWVDDND